MWPIKQCIVQNALLHKSWCSKLQFSSNRFLRIPSNMLQNATRVKQAKCQTAMFLNLKGFVRMQSTSHGQIVTRNPKRVGYWLLGCSCMVYGAITLGGYTRLTESGLSMVTWKFAFENFPSTEEDWLNEFLKYQQYPEYKQLKRDITLDEFKKIWKNEFFHRIWGRLVGLVFLVPAVGFWARGYFMPHMKKRIVALGTMLWAQGLLGWYMVKSGLEDRFHKDTDIPRVSQYRLASHLGLALLLYTGFFWAATELLFPPKEFYVKEAAKKLRIMTHCSKAMIFLTALSGAFVAGLDAGLVYNSFPKMGDRWIPDDILALKPVYRNFTENPTTVQFIHRTLGVTTFGLCLATCILSKQYALPKMARAGMSALFIAACYQVFLGYSTLVNHVPVGLASAHQSGSIFLLSAALLASQQIKNVRYLPK